MKSIKTSSLIQVFIGKKNNNNKLFLKNSVSAVMQKSKNKRRNGKVVFF